MNLKLHTRALAAALLATSLTGAAFAMPGDEAGERPSHAKHYRGDGLPKHLEALGLSDAQKTQIRALHQARWQAAKQTREADRALHESLRELSPAAPNYTSEVNRIATEMGQRHSERIRAKAELRQQQWALLTPSQQAQLAAMPQPEPRKGRWHHME